jgi:hypothetical protein
VIVNLSSSILVFAGALATLLALAYAGYAGLTALVVFIALMYFLSPQFADLAPAIIASNITALEGYSLIGIALSVFFGRLLLQTVNLSAMPKWLLRRRYFLVFMEALLGATRQHGLSTGYMMAGGRLMSYATLFPFGVPLLAAGFFGEMSVSQLAASMLLPLALLAIVDGTTRRPASQKARESDIQTEDQTGGWLWPAVSVIVLFWSVSVGVVTPTEGIGAAIATLLIGSGSLRHLLALIDTSSRSAGDFGYVALLLIAGFIAAHAERSLFDPRTAFAFLQPPLALGSAIGLSAFVLGFAAGPLIAIIILLPIFMPAMLAGGIAQIQGTILLLLSAEAGRTLREYDPSIWNDNAPARRIDVLWLVALALAATGVMLVPGLTGRLPELLMSF